MEGSADIRDLEAQAKHAAERLKLYRAKAYGMRPTSPVRMRELEHAATAAAERLAAARTAAG